MADPEKPTSGPPDDVTGSTEISAVAPDSAAKAVPPTAVSSESASLAKSGDAATITSSNAVAVAPGSGVGPGQAPTVDSNTSSEKAQEAAETQDSKSPLQVLWSEAQAHLHKEMWGVRLADPATHIPSQVILQKYLNANDGDLTKAKEQLKATLDWRARTNPAGLVAKKYAPDKFAGLGYVTTYVGDSSTPEGKEVFTWNIYGGVKDIEKSFGDLDAFIEWRVALMEMAMKELDLSSATKNITADYDPYKMYQVHDYNGTSFFRSPPAARSAAKKTVEVLAMAYPETLKEKFFVNVPAIMGFMYGVMKVFVAPKTAKKFHPMSNGTGLAHEFAESKVSGLGERLPKAYGGKGEDLTKEGQEPLLE